MGNAGSRIMPVHGTRVVRRRGDQSGPREQRRSGEEAFRRFRFLVRWGIGMEARWSGGRMEGRWDRPVEHRYREKLHGVRTGGARTALPVAACTVGVAAGTAIQCVMATVEMPVTVAFMLCHLVLTTRLRRERLQRQVRDQDRKQESQYCDPTFPHEGSLPVRCVHKS